MTSTTPTPAATPAGTTTSTQRISKEVFEEVEKELSAAQAVPVEAVPVDKLDHLAGIVLPYVWTSAIGVWVSGMMILKTLVPLVQCIGAGVATIGVLSAIVFVWRRSSVR